MTDMIEGFVCYPDEIDTLINWFIPAFFGASLVLVVDFMLRGPRNDT